MSVNALFVELMILKLAADMCYAVTGSTEMLGVLRSDLATTMREAKQYDAQEDFPRQWDSGTWHDSRYRGN